MKSQAVFKRYEFKYLLTFEQKERLIAVMKPYMKLDEYGRTTIRNIYFDTKNYRLIRNSLEKPIYKEKLRIRSYEKATEDSKVFVELKKKYNHVVYKRRISLSERAAAQWLSGKSYDGKHTQISNEIDYFIGYYGSLIPSVFLSYEREAYREIGEGNLRITFDENILFRREELSLSADVYGTPILEKGKTLLELKCNGGIPLWLTSFLSEEGIFRTSFSKYGTAYKLIQQGNTNMEDKKYA